MDEAKISETQRTRVLHETGIRTLRRNPACVALTLRTEVAELTGCVAPLTGGRVKIGKQTGLKLL